LKATEFELLWMKNRTSYHEPTSQADLKTIQALEARYRALQ